MTSIQGGNYLGFSSQDEVNFCKRYHTKIQKLVKNNYTKEELQKIETLILEIFPEVAAHAKIAQSIKDNILFHAKQRR